MSSGHDPKSQRKPKRKREVPQAERQSSGEPVHTQGSEPTQVIRVLVADLSGIMLELVTRLVEAQPDMTLVGQVQEQQGQVGLLFAVVRASAMADAPQAIGVDVLVLGAQQVNPPPSICSRLLSEFPNLRILALSPNGDATMMYWLGLRRYKLRTVSQSSLLAGIKKAYRLNQQRR